MLCELMRFLHLSARINPLFRELEKLRQPLILSNPQYSSNPFQTIRTHALNTLVKRADVPNAQ